jgi:hypothetical protein
MTRWTILTCEYPPVCGGVGDYTAQVAAALTAAGDSVTVFCPPRRHVPVQAGLSGVDAAGVEVIVLDDTYGRRSRSTIDEHLNVKPRRSSFSVPRVSLRGANIPGAATRPRQSPR